MNSINDIPEKDFEDIKRRLMSQIGAMNEAELKIAAQSQESLAHYIAGAFQAVARLLGYTIAYPIAMSLKIAKNIWGGLRDGWDSAFENVR